MPARPAARSITAAVVACLVAAGCQAQVADKTGGNVTVLRFASIDSTDPQGLTPAPHTFIKALERLSGGRIRITVQNRYESGAVTAETDLVKAIVAGKLDGGWPATRAFSRAGIRGLEPIEAPLILTSNAAQRALATGPAGRALLRTLDGSGVVGLGLAVGSLRRPWATTEPLVDLRSWHGVTFRSYNSPVQEATIRALGAVPVRASVNFPDLVRAGTLRAAELDLGLYARNGYGTLLPRVVGNVVLWPRMQLLSLSQKRFDALTGQQQRWVRDAAQQAVQASVDLVPDDATFAAHLCAQGVRFTDATPGQLLALRHAVQPVLDGLARDPATRTSLAQVQKVATAHPGTDAINIPATCR